MKYFLFLMSCVVLMTSMTFFDREAGYPDDDDDEYKDDKGWWPFCYESPIDQKISN